MKWLTKEKHTRAGHAGGRRTGQNHSTPDRLTGVLREGPAEGFVATRKIAGNTTTSSWLTIQGRTEHALAIPSGSDEGRVLPLAKATF